jgi:hypothetical protein
MIQHELQTVVRYRLAVTAVIRLLGLWLLITRPLQYINQAVRYLWEAYFSTTSSGTRFGVYDEPVWMITNLIQGSLYLFFGIWMLAKARRIAAWMVPVPKPSCPGCRYDLSSSNAQACPECGLDLSSLQSPTPDSESMAE